MNIYKGCKTLLGCFANNWQLPFPLLPVHFKKQLTTVEFSFFLNDWGFSDSVVQLVATFFAASSQKTKNKSIK